MSEKILKDINIFNSLASDLILDQKKGVSTRIEPKELLEKFNISLVEEGIEDSQLIHDLKSIIISTPKTSGKLFFNQLFGGLNSKAVLGDLIAVLLNNSMSTYKIAGVMVEIEKEIIRNICDLVNYPKDAGGTFPTGGSMSNFMAMIMARDRISPESRNTGENTNLVCYTSEDAHYSIGKNSSFSGIGRNNIRYIPTNNRGEMIAEYLERRICEDLENNYMPTLVTATAGTTVMGSTDPISDIGDICKKYKIWLHIDGSYSGTVIFSDKYKHLINGIEKSDSFCFNAHKTLGTPLSTSIIVVKNKSDIFNSFNNKADYLYQTEEDGEYNLGQTSFECGRRNNALKFWTLWKSIGKNGIAKMIEKNYYLANVAYKYVKYNKDYQLYSYENSLSICFNYKNFDPVDLCTKLYKKNKLMVGYGSHKGETFIRLVSVNRENNEKDILNFFRTLEDFANKSDL